jgi:hypothetical protein
MSQLYNLKFDQMRNNAPDKDGGSESVTYHSSPGGERKLCLVHLDGSRISLSYGFLLWCEYYPNKGLILLGFTSHTVTLTGHNLEKLYEGFEQHTPQKIICKDARYNALTETGKPIVNKIDVSTKGD